MVKVGIIGAGGYAGVTLIQILLGHKDCKIVWLMSEPAHKGKKIAELYPHLLGSLDLTVTTLDDLKEMVAKVDVVFLALPHGIAMDHVPTILEAGKKVIDLGADFRFNDVNVFNAWYETKHKEPKLAKEAVFGLPELYRKQVKKARLIGNPGCYPTSAILALAPMVKEGLIKTDNIVVDSKSGTSGAGRGVSLKALYCERNEGFEAYNVTAHRHMGEIEYQIIRISEDQNTRITFVPHLVPMTRGILSTIHARLTKKIGEKQLMDLYKKFYKGEFFVRVREDVLPNTKYVAGTNFCDIAVKVNERTGNVIIISAIDNLVKGAAGQAVQNMNIMFGIEETEGLKTLALYP